LPRPDARKHENDDPLTVFGSSVLRDLLAMAKASATTDATFTLRT